MENTNTHRFLIIMFLLYLLVETVRLQPADSIALDELLSYDSAAEKSPLAW